MHNGDIRIGEIFVGGVSRIYLRPVGPNCVSPHVKSSACYSTMHCSSTVHSVFTPGAIISRSCEILLMMRMVVRFGGRQRCLRRYVFDRGWMHCVAYLL